MTLNPEMTPKDYGVVALGETLQIHWTQIEDPVNGGYYANLSALKFEATTKIRSNRAGDDTSAFSTVKTGDPEVVVNVAELDVQLFDSTVSETLTIGEVYLFDVWMKESGQPPRTLNLGTVSERRLVGKFRAVRPLNETKQLT
tara:strand:+ start:2265 stop:2693 length:429 start_codon:yes stop_codon:yes gene_type:complete